MSLDPPVVVLTGAGVSTASGIPDFRSPGGVWERFDPIEFTIGRFHADPATFWDRRARLVAAMDYLDARPNRAHKILAQAVQDGRVATLVTQNVDGLHAAAGTPPDRLIEVHGNGRCTVCTGCGKKEDLGVTLTRRGTSGAAAAAPPIREPRGPTPSSGVPPDAPACPDCGAVMKPDVVLFGEPVLALQAAADAVAAARTLVVAGTSLQVYPVAGLVPLALAGGARVVICNRDPTPFDTDAARVLRGPVDASLALLFPPPTLPPALQ